MNNNSTLLELISSNLSDKEITPVNDNHFFSSDIDIISEWLNQYNIKNYTIRENGLVDVEGNVQINNTELTEFPIQFGIVTGNFDCYNNKLISLKGAPKEVYGSFICASNNLTTLLGSPEKVHKNFYCGYNKLTTLVGMPIIGGDFNCFNNKIYSLKGIRILLGHVNASYNCISQLDFNLPKFIGGINLNNQVINKNKNEWFIPLKNYLLKKDKITHVLQSYPFISLCKNDKIILESKQEIISIPYENNGSEQKVIEKENFYNLEDKQTNEEEVSAQDFFISNLKEISFNLNTFTSTNSSIQNETKYNTINTKNLKSNLKLLTIDDKSLLFMKNRNKKYLLKKINKYPKIIDFIINQKQS